jgi:hypothetical protein
MMNQIDEHIFGFSQQKKMLQEGTSWNLTRKVVFFIFELVEPGNESQKHGIDLT